VREILISARDRAALRRQVRIPCQIVEEESFSLIANESIDLSVRGMRVKALRAVPVGTRVIASFRVPGSSLYLDLDAEVTRVLWGRRKGDRCTALGLSFFDLSAVDRAILGSRLMGLPPPAPERRLRFDYAGTIAAIARGFSFAAA